ncbi:M56 family metallopeptidase [Paenibacillus donghaensis]|uniref:Peptidase M56 domain-containing protein n=1 Tax=Paenibacillus donghaensis TaxID=414771 RepID=A0A2Z2KVC6_9BACL|nr:M56 family metallopeptidase [Paenibacillus donghaensis]ASA25181.1 hypothetical protein B9T62_33275 [Paenibacillus donghaensis]
MLDYLLTTMVEIILSTSLIIVLVLLLGRTLSRRYAPKWRYWIWLALAVRLLIPFNLTAPQPLVQIIPPIQEAMIPQKTAVDKASAPIQSDKNGNPVPAVTAAPNKPMSAQAGIALLWLSGAGGVLIYHCVGHLIFMSSIRRWSRPVGEQQVLELFSHSLRELKLDSRKVKLRRSTAAPSPMLAGLLKPTVWLPAELYSDEEYLMIFKHELIHYKQRHLWYKLLMLVVRAVHWFNPLVYLMVREANKEVELVCDSEVVKGTDIGYRKRYSEIILSMIRRPPSNAASLSTPFNGGKQMMKQRFAGIFDRRKKHNGVGAIVTAGLLLVLAGVLVACSTTAPKSDAIQEAIEAATQYKNTEYEVAYSSDILSVETIQQRNDQMVPFFTEYFAEKAVSTRYTGLPLQVAAKQQASVTSDNLELSLSEDKGDVIELKYYVDLVLLDQAGAEQQRVPLEGILTLFDVEDQWLVQGDRFDSNAFMKLVVP